MTALHTYKVSALGDSAIIVDFGNVIDETINKKVIALFHYLNKFPFDGLTETAPAYSSLTVFYDVAKIRKRIKTTTAFEWVKQQLQEILNSDFETKEENSEIIRLPVFYNSELSPDLEQMASVYNISKEEIIHLHTSRIYRVYMLGFLPGFAYMGEVDSRIAFPRKIQPKPVEVGSVGIAGKQTGIYPLSSPGGWQVIGRTPVKMFEVIPEISSPQKTSVQYSCFLQPGNYVQFYKINKEEFEHLINSAFHTIESGLEERT